MRRALALVVAGVAAAGVPGPARAQGGPASSPGREILVLSFEAGKLPDIVQPVRGSLVVVARNGIPMLRAASPAEFVLQLPEVLPKQFTLEFEVVPKECCNPDLTFEGGQSINQSAASAHVLWDADGALQVIGGGAQPFSMQMPAALAAPGAVAHVAMTVQEDGTLRFYTNGQRNFTLAERRFSRAKALRVSLGGEDADQKAVYLARIRVTEGAATGTLIAQRAATVGGGQAVPPAMAVPVTAPPTQTATATPVAEPVTAVPVTTTTTATATPVAGAPTVTGVTAPQPIAAADRPTTSAAIDSDLLVGVGMSDITGPISEVVMMGYADGDQKAAGLHTRLYARAFIFANRTSGKRVVWVSAELAMLFSAVKQGVLKRLAARFGPLYTDDNVMLSATHTHAGPGGYSHHTIYNISIGGFVRPNYDAIVEGITEAIVQAHERLAPGGVSLLAHDVSEQTMVNRSRDAFMLNAEALAVPPAPDINRDMALLKIYGGGRTIGVIAFHAVHNTSMTGTNRLISSDHKGHASYLVEKWQGSIAPFQRYGEFVAAFPNGAEGDMSPNLNTDSVTVFKGPSSDEFESTEIIGSREFRAAFQLFNAPQTDVGTDVDFRHKFVLMPGTPVPSSSFTNGSGLKLLCTGAYGMSFMAGAEDGRSGMLEGVIREGMALGSTAEKAALDAARVLALGIIGALMPALGPVLAPAVTTLSTAFMAASADQCQYPKPIILPTGFMHWSPEILPFQILRIGSVAIAGIPGEMTMQAGRRLEAAIRAVLLPLGVQRVLLTGLANEYSGYITTPEEYVSQQYEGASTLFGRLTYDAYQEVFRDLGVAMASGKQPLRGPPPGDLGAMQLEWMPAIDHDEVPVGDAFGRILLQPPPTAARGTAVRVIYRSGNPRNDFRRNDTYIRIERDAGGGNWVLAAWDGIPETRLTWTRSYTPIPTQNGLVGQACPGTPCYWSTMDVNWFVPGDATPGTYRIRVFGSWKNGVTKQLVPYEGTTMSFTVQ